MDVNNGTYVPFRNGGSRPGFPQAPDPAAPCEPIQTPNVGHQTNLRGRGYILPDYDQNDPTAVNILDFFLKLPPPSFLPPQPVVAQIWVHTAGSLAVLPCFFCREKASGFFYFFPRRIAPDYLCAVYIRPTTHTGVILLATYPEIVVVRLLHLPHFVPLGVYVVSVDDVACRVAVDVSFRLHFVVATV